MIRMRVRQQNDLNFKMPLLGNLKERTAIRARIENRGLFRCRIPSEIDIDRHVLVGRVELSKSIDGLRLRIPTFFRAIDQRLRGQTQNWSHLLDRGLVDIAFLNPSEISD